MPSIEDTKAFVAELHAGQLDKGGAPYIGHVIRVYQRLLKRFPKADEDVLHAALLHDAIEDCDVTATDLLSRGYSENTIQIVEAVTKDPQDGLTYAERIERLATSGNRGAIQVKICDLMDNSDPQRLAVLPARKARELSNKYHSALTRLQAAINRVQL